MLSICTMWLTRTLTWYQSKEIEWYIRWTALKLNWLKMMFECLMTYWACAHPPLRCTRQTPDPWTAAAAPWSCSAGNRWASRTRPAPSSSPHKTPPAGYTERRSKKVATETRKINTSLLHLLRFHTVAKIKPTRMLVSVRLLKRFVLVPDGGRETVLLYFWCCDVPMSCLATPVSITQTQTNTSTRTRINMHTEHTRNHFHDLIHSPLNLLHYW